MTAMIFNNSRSKIQSYRQKRKWTRRKSLEEVEAVMVWNQLLFTLESDGTGYQTFTILSIFLKRLKKKKDSLM